MQGLKGLLSEGHRKKLAKDLVGKKIEGNAIGTHSKLSDKFGRRKWMSLHMGLATLQVQSFHSDKASFHSLGGLEQAPRPG